MTNSRKKGLLVIGIIIILLFVLLIFNKKFLNNNNNNNNKTPKNEEVIEINKCTIKGNVCSWDEIFQGIKISYEVAPNVFYNFHLINNSDTTMTLLMDNNIENHVNWYDQFSNIRGPLALMDSYINNCNKWSNIEDITNYYYWDYGHKSFIEYCSSQNNDISFNCDDYENQSYGYDHLAINNDGKVTVFYTEDDKSYFTFEEKIKARAITESEFISLESNGKYPSWLIENLNKNEGYWTLSSSVTPKTSYGYGAYAIVNLDGKPSIETAFVKLSEEKTFDIGIRPVITVPKR